MGCCSRKFLKAVVAEAETGKIVRMSRKQGIYGIDLGTTYSVVAYIDETGQAAVVRNVCGDDATPSVVFFESETNVVVGKVAREMAGTFPDRVVSLIKLEMGNRDYIRTFFGREHTPPSISALILAALAKDAVEDTQRLVREVVICVPAYFGLLEKDATKRAGEIAGLEVIGIIPEPVAAAVHYGVTGTAAGAIALVYDLGGATFDVSLIRMTDRSVEVLAVDGNHRLGGADWDTKLFDHIVEQTIEQAGGDSILDDEQGLQELRLLAESTKQALSKAESKAITHRHAGTAVKIVVTRKQFEEMTADLLEETIRITRRMLADAEEQNPGAGGKITELLLAGGSSWMPAVAERLKQEFPWEPRLADPHLAVAKGAAVYAAGQTASVVADTQAPVPQVAGDEAIAGVASQTGLDVIEVAVASSALVPFVQALAAKAADDFYTSLRRLLFRKQPRRSRAERNAPTAICVADEYTKLVLQLPPTLNDETQESLHRLLVGLTSRPAESGARWLQISQAAGSTSSWNIGIIDTVPDNCVTLQDVVMTDSGGSLRIHPGELRSDHRRQEDRLSALEQERKLLRRMVKYLAAEIDLAE